MEELIGQILSREPYIFSSDNLLEHMDTFVHQNISLSIYKTKKGIFITDAVHEHDTYEFCVPLNMSFVNWLDKKKVTVAKNRIFPYNPLQEHGSTENLSDVLLLDLHLKKKCVQEICYLVHGKGDLSFKNESSRLSVKLQSLIQLFMEESRGRQKGYEFILQSLESQILVYLLRELKSDIVLDLSESTYKEKKNINRALEFLHEHFDEEFSLEMLASVANLSPYHFIKIFKEQTDKTPYQYFLDIKIEKACYLLKHTNQNITEICYACGFNNSNHFASVFKRKTGFSASVYRKLWMN